MFVKLVTGEWVQILGQAWATVTLEPFGFIVTGPYNYGLVSLYHYLGF